MDTHNNTTSSASSSRRVPLTVWVGENAPHTTQDQRVVVVSPGAPTPVAVVEAVRAAGITSPDLRGLTFVAFDSGVGPVESVAVYTALCVLAGRRLDAVVEDAIVALASLHSTLVSLPALPLSGEPAECIQVGAPHPTLPSVTIEEGGVSPEDLALLRGAQRVRLAVGSSTIAELLAAFTAVAALRSSTGNDRLPMLVEGHEPADPSPLNPGDLPAGFDLAAVRAGALELKRAQRPRSAAAVAPSVELSPRLIALRAADAVAITDVLSALGSTSVDGSAWGCTRPDLHTNGDAKPSARVHGNAFRCHRCDAEPLGPVLLVSATRNVTADEAATWLAATFPQDT